MAKANPFRFSTKCQDDETDLLYYGYRYYNASTGRWLGRDPNEEELGGENLYAFADNDSVDFLDQLGLCTSCAGAGAIPQAAPSPQHTCPIGKLTYKRGAFKKVSTVAEIKSQCGNTPSCSKAPYTPDMKCKKCTSPGCGQWSIILNIKATCNSYYLDPKKVTTFSYVPDLNHAIKHEDCHCDDHEQAFQDVIGQVGSTQYQSEAQCNAAMSNIDVIQMVKNQIAPSQAHVDPKWGVAPLNPNAACYGTWRGRL